ncbi:chorismate--pyruvate lyase family protein [Marinospirillum perlucidum]|uniref:chorismate--pyruvate lyase family protein n=1 Tax=Marinospirillum perlucidum TaxID=1982602 RepID=UPI000DF20EBC|nr:chorismate lyase [Marinospirillum perlucidum]
MQVTDRHLRALDSWPAPAWQPAAFLAAAPSGDWRSWLQEEGSLTRRLQQQAHTSFRVRVLNEGLLPINQHEAAWLASQHRRIWVRQVLLEVDGEPWVFARSLLPLDSRGSLLRRLKNTGNKALGHLLFTHPHIQRGPLHFCAPGQLPFASYWGRASCFNKASLRLLVAEHFLPAMQARLQLPTRGIYGD